MIIILDMDGVLVDFVGGALRVNGVDPQEAMERWKKGEFDVARAAGMPESDFWTAVWRAGRSFWANLEPYPWATPIADLALRVADEVYIATLPQPDPESFAGKVECLYRHFPGIPFFTVPRGEGYSAAKELLAGHRRVLIDDNDVNCATWAQAGGYSIIFPQQWNWGELDKNQDRTAYVRRQLRAAEMHFRR